MSNANGGPFDDGEKTSEKGRGDITKKILTLGLGAYFLTEDTVRRYVKDAKMPREIGRAITSNASKGKDELYGFVARELSDFIKQMDLQAELDRFVKSHKIRVSAEIEFLPQTTGEGGDEGSDESPIEWNVSFKEKPDKSEAAGEDAGSDEAVAPLGSDDERPDE